MKLVFGTALLTVALVGCSVSLSSFKNKTPEFKMNEFFKDKLCAWGVVRNRSGEVSRKFVADIVATAEKDKVVLDEDFIFDDGEKQKRVWNFVRKNNQWIGTAGDVVDEAIGEVKGDTLHLTYELAINVDGSEYVIAMDDWLHLVDKKTLMGSTDMSKWGFNVGRIDISIQQSQAVSCLANL